MAEWILWRPEYQIQVPKIDQQHEELFRMFNELGDALWDGKGRESIGKSLNFLANYTVEHFQTEEEIMKTSGYPGYDEHKRLHDSLVGEVSEFIQKFDFEELAHSEVLEVVNRIGNWTREHVRMMDQKLGAWLRENGEAA